jgi:hypothetical protein
MFALACGRWRSGPWRVWARAVVVRSTTDDGGTEAVPMGPLEPAEGSAMVASCTVARQRKGKTSRVAGQVGLLRVRVCG